MEHCIHCMVCDIQNRLKLGPVHSHQMSAALWYLPANKKDKLIHDTKPTNCTKLFIRYLHYFA